MIHISDLMMMMMLIRWSTTILTIITGETGDRIAHSPISQWVNSVPPYVRKLHFMYEVVRTSSKCRWNIYRTSSKCRWGIYRTSRKRRGTLRVVHKAERSSPTVHILHYIYLRNGVNLRHKEYTCQASYISNAFRNYMCMATIMR